MNRTLQRVLATALACAAWLAAPAVNAQAYPDKPVRIVVPYPPGGGADILARAIGQRLGVLWGQTVVIDNKAGAGGSIGTDLVAKAPADGYTLLMASPSHAINNALYKNLAFDAEKNFSGVVLAASGPLVLVVNAASPYKTLEDFIGAAKANPSGINYASAGIGSSPHLAGELFALQAGVKMTHVAYKGTAPALTDLMGNQVQAFFGPVPTIIEHVRQGRLRALAVTTTTPFAALPGVPPIGSKVPDYAVLQWWGLVAPAGTPAAIIDKINKDVSAILAEPEMKKQLDAMGADPGQGSPAQFDALIHDEVIRWAYVIKRADLKPE